MKKKIYQLFLFLSLFLITIALRTNSYKLCAIIIWLNIKKLKAIKSNNKNTKKVLVFSKSGGYEDLIESYYNSHNNKITFFLLPRAFLKKIFYFYFEKNYKHNYFTKPIDKDEINKKNSFIKYSTSAFSFINNFLKLDGFISFNIFYREEKYFEEVCKNLDKKFIILHKESVFTPLEEANAPAIYEKYNEKSLSYKISVYSESQKKILIKSKIATKTQVIVNGCPRSDYAFRLRRIKPKKKIIVFYLIEHSRSQSTMGILLNKNRKTNYLDNNTKKNWKKLYKQTFNYLIEFAKNNPDIKIILKGKVGVHKKNDLNSKIFPKNCIFIEGGSGEEWLKDASVVIAFNSTIVFEAIASNRNLIIPNFNSENKIKKNVLHIIKDKKKFVNSKKQFNKKINFYLDSKYKNKKISTYDIETLKYYVGNTDGTSGKKVKEFLKKIFN